MCFEYLAWQFLSGICVLIYLIGYKNTISAIGAGFAVIIMPMFIEPEKLEMAAALSGGSRENIPARETHSCENKSEDIHSQC